MRPGWLVASGRDPVVDDLFLWSRLTDARLVDGTALIASVREGRWLVAAAVDIERLGAALRAAVVAAGRGRAARYRLGTASGCALPAALSRQGSHSPRAPGWNLYGPLPIAQILIALSILTSILLRPADRSSSTFGGESTAYRSRRGSSGRSSG